MHTKQHMREILIPKDIGTVKKADIKAALRAVKAQRLAGRLPKIKYFKPVYLHIPKCA